MAGVVDIAGGRSACGDSAMGEVVGGWGFRGSGEVSVGQWGKVV
jgi:hypothetical protein